MKIVYEKPEDATPFDLDRYYKSLNRYGKVSKESIAVEIEKLRNQFSDTIHVSCLVNLGARLIEDEDRAREYWEAHTKNLVGFERLRRITGYLVGTLERWNDGKKAEERERVKHSVGQYTVEEKIRREEKKQEQILSNQD